MKGDGPHAARLKLFVEEQNTKYGKKWPLLARKRELTLVRAAYYERHEFSDEDIHKEVPELNPLLIELSKEKEEEFWTITI